jgi:hypothetical protein
VQLPTAEGGLAVLLSPLFQGRAAHPQQGSGHQGQTNRP